MSNSNIPAKAPFNFVSLPSKFIERYEDETQLPEHGRLYSKEEGYYSGEISYKAVIDDKSALFISDGKLSTDKRSKTDDNREKKVDEFFKNAHGQYTIPGSSMRGLIYNNIQILGLCDPRDFIEDSRFTYRDVASNDNHHNKKYKQILGIEQGKGKSVKGKEKSKEDLHGVRAGYLRKDGERYELTPAKNYYKVKEDEIPDKLKNDDKKRICCMYSDQEEQKTEFQNTKQKKGKAAKIENPDYHPYYCPIYYKLNDKKQVLPNTLQFDGGKNLEKGYLMCAGFISGKQTHYVIGAKESSGVISIEENSEAIRLYQDDLARRKQTFAKDINNSDGEQTSSDKGNKNEEFYELPKDNETEKPVFYLEHEGIIYLGMTPYLRILYKYSVHDGIHPKKVRIDYAKAMFGFMQDSKDKKNSSAYKSRLSFTDAPAEGEIKMGEPVEILPASPKPTCYPEYILQNKDYLDSYADHGFTIRGYKQYWLSDKLKRMKREDGAEENQNVVRKIRPIQNGKFQGKIYFENLTKDELGLLAYALKIKDGAYQGIGMAKAYGYGRIRIEDIEIKSYDYDAMYHSFAYGQDSYTKENVDELIKAYKEYVLHEREINIQDDPGIDEFIYMKTHILDAALTEYQKLDEFSENRILPTVKEYKLEHERPHAASPKEKQTRNTQPKEKQPRNTQSKEKQFYGNHNGKKKKGGNFTDRENKKSYSDSGFKGNMPNIPKDWYKS